MSIGKGVTTVVMTDAATSLNSANNDDLVYTPFKPANVQRIGLIVDSSTASGTDLILSLEKRPTAGSDTDREVLMTLQPSATVEQGEGIYFDADDRYEVNPGEELVLDASTAAGVAATGRMVLEVVEYPFQHTSTDSDEDRLGNMTEET